MAWIISAADGLTHFIKIRGKENIIHQDKNTIKRLQDKIYNLEMENTILKDKKETAAEKSQEHVYSSGSSDKPSVFQRLFPSSTRHYSKQI